MGKNNVQKNISLAYLHILTLNLTKISFLRAFSRLLPFFMSYSLVSLHFCFVHLLRLFMYAERYIDKSKTHAFASTKSRLLSIVLFFFLYVDFNIFFCYFLCSVSLFHSFRTKFDLNLNQIETNRENTTNVIKLKPKTKRNKM